MKQEQFEKFQRVFARVIENSPFYRAKYKETGLVFEDIKSPDDIAKIPFTTKGELRKAYPLDLSLIHILNG